MDVAGRKIAGALSRSLTLPLCARPANPGLHYGNARCIFSLQRQSTVEPLVKHSRTKLANSSAVCARRVSPLTLNYSLNKLLFFGGGYKESEGGGGVEGGLALALGAGLLLCATGSGGI